MKKILLVGVLGGFILLVALWTMGRRKNDAMAVFPAAGTPAETVPGATTAAVSPAVVPAASLAVPAVPAPPVAPVDDRTACARLADLCSTSDEKVDKDACIRKLGDARTMSGASNVERSEVCLVDAKTCAAASGCISGGIGMGATGEFLKGLGAALSR